MKAKEIREKSTVERQKLLDEKRARLCQLRFDANARQIKNYREIRTIKQDIARLLTLNKEPINQVK